jgi:SEC-C motif-containing protein
MRSRYSAFCDGNINYLSQTLAPEKRSKDDSTQLQQTIKTTQWCRLQVIKHNQKGDQGQVEFVAFFTEHGKVGQLHELSEFVRRDNLWYYLNGVQLPLIKLQRNDPCWCGSGKKLKKCCNNFS